MSDVTTGLSSLPPTAPALPGPQPSPPGPAPSPGPSALQLMRDRRSTYVARLGEGMLAGFLEPIALVIATTIGIFLLSLFSAKAKPAPVENKPN